MQTLKQEAIEALTKLPENAVIEDMMYRLYVIDKIHEGREAVKNGQFVTVEQLRKEMLSW